jgi:hypothetical protein
MPQIKFCVTSEVMIHSVSWVIIPCILLGVYQNLGGKFCLHLLRYGELAFFNEKLVPIYKIACLHHIADRNKFCQLLVKCCLYRVTKYSRFTWWLQYTSFLPQYVVLSDCLTADCQGQGDSRLTLTPSVIPNSNYVNMISDWNCLKYFCKFFFLYTSGAQRLFYQPVYLNIVWALVKWTNKTSIF